MLRLHLNRLSHVLLGLSLIVVLIVVQVRGRADAATHEPDARGPVVTEQTPQGDGYRLDHALPQYSPVPRGRGRF